MPIAPRPSKKRVYVKNYVKLLGIYIHIIVLSIQKVSTKKGQIYNCIFLLGGDKNVDFQIIYDFE